jgi:hypothetical protein
VIQTRSGTKIIMNDAVGSVFIEDPSGNTWMMDGNGNISVNAPNDITMNAGGNVTINAGQNISSSAGMSIMESATINHSITSGALMSQNAGGDYNLMAANILEIANGEKKSNAKETKEVSEQREIQSEKDSKIHSQETFNNNAGEKSNNY